LSTPSKIITISTPLRPCPRAKYREMQDDLKAAVEERSVPLLRVLLQRCHPCLADHALHEAIRQAHLPAVRLLLLQGRSDPNVRCQCLERGCELPLQLAVTCASFLRGDDRCQAVELLLRAGAAPNPRRGDAEASAPLHDAVRRGDAGVAQLLLRHGADPNAANGFGETPLHMALRLTGGEMQRVPGLFDGQGHRLAEMLLQAGACPLGPGGIGLPAVALTADPATYALVESWARWWRCRMLAWIRSRARGHFLRDCMPELCVQIAAFL